MHFQLLKIILWSKGEHAPRVVDFVPGMVNVISGASKTGKSAVIPIIDYCLASKSCSIPVGVIRDKCAWFGVIVDTAEGQKLFARREPGMQQSTGDMYVIESTIIDIPTSIGEKNTNDEATRGLLDRLAGLTQLDFEANPEFGYKLRPSFRDLAAFMFQPQNIVANPGVLFYKADTTEHREKLKTVLPYALNAITPRILALRHEVDQLNRKLRRMESDLKYMLQVSARRISEGRTWLNQARELGIAQTSQDPATWPEIVAELEKIAGNEISFKTTTIGGIDDTLLRLEELRREESRLVAEASTHRQRLMELKRLREGSSQYAGALRLQRERLSLSTWMRNEIENRQDFEAIFSTKTATTLDDLCDALNELEGQLRSFPLATTTLDAEYLRQRTQTEDVLGNLASLRQEIRAYEATSKLAEQEIRRTASVDRFLGGLQQVLVQYAQADSSSTLSDQIDELKGRIDKIQAEIQEGHIQRRLDSILNEIQQITSNIVPHLNAEWGESPVRLVPKELTVQVSREGRKDYLWEIGSGANWLAYHVAITLALQIYFLRHPPSSVPSMLVYDQPSQVYFPKLSMGQKTGQQDFKLTDQEDIQAVRRVFKAIGDQVVTTKGQLQVIVLDHAHDEVWGDLQGITLVEEWRDGIKLVPEAW